MNDNALAVRDESNQLVQVAHHATYTREQIELLKRTVARGTTDDEFALFLNTAKRMGLDPFARQIFAVKRWSRRENREVMSIQVSIDGFRATASRTGELDGQDGPYWCGEDGVWKDVWLGKVAPSAAKVLVFRKGCSKPFTGIATFMSYAQRGSDGNLNDMWRRGADFMIAKCAEAVALRKGFPAELSNVYSPEEMGQADNPAPAAERPPVSTVRDPAVDAELVQAAREKAATQKANHDLSADDELEAAAIALIKKIDAAGNALELKEFTAEINAMPKGSRARHAAWAAYQTKAGSFGDPSS